MFSNPSPLPYDGTLPWPQTPTAAGTYLPHGMLILFGVLVVWGLLVAGILVGWSWLHDRGGPWTRR